jgi:predicted TIM-barrel fold metal-dependent hydrolase
MSSSSDATCLTDGHAHLITPDVARYPPSPLGGQTVDPRVFDAPMTAEMLLGAMDAAGVARAVVVQRAFVYGFDNAYVMSAASNYPARLAAVVCVDGSKPGAGTVSRDLFARGARAVRFAAQPGEDGVAWFAGPHAIAIWTQAAGARRSLVLHVRPDLRDVTLGALPELLRRFPTVPFVLDHAGGPDHAAAGFGLDVLAPLAQYPAIVLKVTSVNFAKITAARKDPADFLTALVERFGGNRVMWGSDVAQTPGSSDRLVIDARSAARRLDAAARRAVLYQTAASLYFDTLP